MKRIYLILLFFVACSTYAQVGIGTATPSDAAMLEVDGGNATTGFRGFMPPVLTIAQRDLVPVTASDVGMLVFVNDVPNGVQCLQFWDGTTWVCQGGSSAGRTVVARQDFEVTPAGPILNFSDAGAGMTLTGMGGNPVSNLFVSGSQGYGVNNGVSNITFAPVDLSAFASGTLEFKLGAFSTTTGTSGGADGGDTVEVFVTSGGLTESYEFFLAGNDNSLYDFTGAGVVESLVDQDNNQTSHRLLAGGGSLSGLDAQSTVTLLGLPNDPDVQIRIVLTNNGTPELWAIDDVVIYGE
ncbi:hypothetical protein EAX61_06725 [Dokdonia sinensis]|uniref:PEP-CTERM sorting domain-containing protein n=1 Tax=Dokdonia sinensis TaxID=2479847 RepID=A0A3M0G646_9FLAO|nr:hypothetical protein [Dokdonia sinensis]RMB60510.1 hypothetical protein EAX61_06725 [Dokdonia sinensis]